MCQTTFARLIPNLTKTFKEFADGLKAFAKQAQANI
jgi:hypothetical protein